MWKQHNPNKEITGVIMHTCDTPNCVNPAHLVHGTQAENIADMVAKGRRVTVKGSAQKDAKLTESDIPVIRTLLASGVSGYRISKQFKVSEQTIRFIKQGKTWKHVK
jgi:DNA-binding NarL/FixJ family response regulator